MKIKQNKNYEKRNTKQNCDQHEETIKQKTTVKKKTTKKRRSIYEDWTIYRKRYHVEGVLHREREVMKRKS